MKASDICLYFWGFACSQLQGVFGLLTQIATFIAIVCSIIETIQRIRNNKKNN
ncbi:MAG: hypothetical protein Ta2D_11050 [Rickettsiales bacterium]|nr:MAG: hypothetical protein Ta2D_11050 [Rickettsiales bacterium]